MTASAGTRRSGARALLSGVASRVPWAVDAYRAVRHPGWAWELHRDVRSTRARTEFLRGLAPPAPDAPVVLVGLYRDYVHEAKLGLTLSAALRVRGARPVVSIPSKRAHRLRRYAAAFGVSDVVVHDEIPITDGERAEIAETRAALLAGPGSFEAIRAWEFRSYAIGGHVLSSLIRVTFDGSPDLRLDENRDHLAAILTEVLENYVRDERTFAELRPRAVLVDEANYSVNGPLVDVAVHHGVDVVQTVPTWRDDALMSKRLTKANRRVDAHSVSAETMAEVVAAPWGRHEEDELEADFAARYGGRYELGRVYQPGTQAFAPERIRAELGIAPDRRVCVLFTHVLWDATLFFGVDLFENYADWLVQSVAAAVENSEVHWIVKTHPANVFLVEHGWAREESSELALLRRRFPALPAHITVLPADTPISARSLYEFADVGITVRGTPGMEMPCFGKPVLTAGTGAYWNLGFTADSTTRDEYLERLASIHEYPMLGADVTVRARQHLHALFVRRPWTTGAFRVTFDHRPGGWHPLDQNVELVARDVQAFRSLGDLDEWAQWVLESDAADFVPRAHW